MWESGFIQLLQIVIFNCVRNGNIGDSPVNPYVTDAVKFRQKKKLFHEKCFGPWCQFSNKGALKSPLKIITEKMMRDLDFEGSIRLEF